MNSTILSVGLSDLHLHLDGSISLDSARRLAAMQQISLPEDDKRLRQLLTVDEDCRDLNQYLEKFAFPCSLLQRPEALSLAVETLMKELAANGVDYAEVRFAPQKHTDLGMSQQEAVEAALDGFSRSPIGGGLILCCMRGDDNHAENLLTVETARGCLGRGVLALDLAGAEGLFPTRGFADLFERARACGIPFTIHAGEADGPESVWRALGFGASRIGHGVRSVEDPRLVEVLAERQIPLELCPSSNLQTCVFPCIEDYPLRRLMQAGVKVTINTDNMSVSGTSQRRELELVAHTFSLSSEEVAQLVRNGHEAAFSALSM